MRTICEVVKATDEKILGAWAALNSAIAGQEMTATRRPVHQTDGKNPDGTYRYREVGTAVSLQYVHEDSM